MTAAQTGNGGRLAAQPLSGGGTARQVWAGADLDLPALDLGECPEIVVVGAHPDDETLGFGAAAAVLAESGVRVQIVSASDGGAAYPDSSLLQRFRLERTRRAELHCAAGVLGLPAPICLGMPDGEIARHERRLTDLLIEILATKPAGTWIAATWRGDGHPDHEAVGRAAASAAECTDAVLVEYPVWMWHWAVPGDSAVPWGRALAVPAVQSAVALKALAVKSFRSQFVPQAPGQEPVLPDYIVPRLLTVGEVVFR
jgi:LmbE family N-acetylglucosaminyl deacetylase